MGILEVKDLNVFYGSIHAVKDVSFEVNEGEIIALIGANGAGKTTILQTISKLLKAESGNVVFYNESLMKLPAHKIITKGLGMVPEGRRIFQNMTVKENLELGAYTQSKSSFDETIKGVYDHFPRLQERENQIAGTLSGGEQQMLAMGRALMAHPKLLMLDEPSMGLSPILVDEIFKIIKELNEAGTTILLVEQNAKMALSIADRGYVLETGKIVKTDKASVLLHDDDVRKAYLGG